MLIAQKILEWCNEQKAAGIIDIIRKCIYAFFPSLNPENGAEE